MITIDYQNRLPIYEQIVERFEVLILKGVLPSGSQMPSVRSLAMELSINPNTIQKAYTILENKGYIYSVKGRGNYVAENRKLFDYKMKSFQDSLKVLLNEAKELGISKEQSVEILENCWRGLEEDDRNDQPVQVFS